MKSNTTRIMTTIGRSRMIPVLLCTLMLSTSPAVAGDAGHRPMRFDQLTLDDGLSQSNVLSIWQDSRGLMWFGTENGLTRYNGYEFRRFTRERGNPLALGSDFVYDIAEDADGNLWLGTNGGGLAMMNRNTSQFTSFRHDPDDPNSSTIKSDDQIQVVLVLKRMFHDLKLMLQAHHESFYHGARYRMGHRQG